MRFVSRNSMMMDMMYMASMCMMMCAHKQRPAAFLSV